MQDQPHHHASSASSVPGNEPPVARPIEATMAHYGWTRTFIFDRLAKGKLEGVKAGRRTTITSVSAERLFQSLPRGKYRKAGEGMAV